MCANSRHRAERRANELTRTPQALIERVNPPTFDLVSLRGLEASRLPRHARKVETTYAKYVGRIGALAVSLGVGVAVATTPGMAWAAPDSDSDAGASAAPGPKTSPDANPDTSTSSKPDTSNPEPSKPDTSTSSQTTATETPAEGSSSKGDTNPTNDRVPAMKVDSSGGAITSTLRTAGETASSATDASSKKDVAAATPETSASAATSAPAEAAPVEPVVPEEPVVEVPVVPVVEVPVEPVVNPTDPHNDSPKPNDGPTAGSDGKPRTVVDHVQSSLTDKGGSDTSSTAADDTARHMSALTSGGQTEDSSKSALMSALVAPQVQAPAPFDPVGALLAIPGQLFDVASGFVALVITPFLAPTPNAPAQMPLLWTVLAWVRREISHTFFNRSPIANPVQISQAVSGEVTGNLNATDPNGDEPLTYTVTQQPAHGTVVVRPDGTYIYTPTAGAPTSTLTDGFTVSIDDSVGTRLPGIFGVVQGILHSLAQAIGIAQPDTTVKQVAVTVAGTGVNLPPLVVTSVINPIPYTAGSAPRVLDSNLTVVDGSSNLSGGTVSIGLGFTPGDTLTYTPPANNPITGSYNSATGVLTLTGTATVAQYQDALRAVAFSTTSNSLVGVRTVSFVVTDDGGLSSISVPLAVTVLALNLPPVVTTSVVGPIVTAGNPPVTLDANVTIIDGSGSMTGAQVSLGLGFSPGDTLGYTSPQNNPITGSYNAATGVFTLSGTGTVAQYQEALRAITFSTTANALIGVRTVSFVVTDDGGLSSISVPLAVTVLGVNLPPVVTTSVVGPIVTAGNPPVTLDANVTIVDGSASLTGGTVTIGLGFSQGDTLGYTAPQNNPITGSYNAATGVLTLSGTGTVLQYQEALRAITFSTTAGAVVGLRTVSFVVTDVEGASSISVPLAVTVLALNLPPVVTTSVVGPIVTAGNPPVTLDANVTIVDGSASLTGGTVTIGLGFSQGDTLGYTAPQNNPIMGSYNAVTGVLTLSGTGTVAQYQEALRAITFSTTAGAVVGVRTVSFVVTDVEGASSISVPLAVTVLALNLPPVVTTSVVGPIVTAGNPPVTLDANVTIVDGSASLTGGTVSIGLGFSQGDTLGYTAPQNNPIMGSYNAVTGVLTLSGTGTVAQYQEALRAITFSTTAGAVVGLRTVSFVVADVEGASSISVPLAVTVLALNLPPVVTTSVVGPIVTAGNPPVTLDANVTIVDGSASLTGGTVSIGLGFSQGDTLGYTAPQNNPITGSYNAATGVLTLMGTGTVAQYQEALRAITFSTTAGAVVGARTVSFVVTDDGALSSISVPLAVTVLALNLPPVVTTSVVGPIVTAGSGAVTLDANVTIVDGSPTITGATVSITLGHDSSDTLGYTAPQNNPIIGSYNAATGVLTLSGTGTVAQYQEALRAITFSTGASTLASVRTVSFVVTDDGGLSSISVPLAVTVLAINLPPVVVTTILNPIPFTAGNAPTVLDPNVSIIDGSASLSGATVAITIGLTAGDSLAFTQPAGSSIVGSYNSTTGVLTLTGAGTVAQYQEALRSVTFATTAATLVGVRTVSFVVTDVGGLPSVSVPLAVTVALNLPPIVTSSVVGLSLNLLNGAPPEILDPGVLIVDDSSTLTGATVTVGGIVIGGNDTLSFTPPPGSGITGLWNSSTKTLTLAGAATVAEYQTALRSVTFATSGILNLGARIVSFVVKDQQGQSSISVPLTVVVVGIL